MPLPLLALDPKFVDATWNCRHFPWPAGSTIDQKFALTFAKAVGAADDPTFADATSAVLPLT